MKSQKAKPKPNHKRKIWQEYILLMHGYNKLELSYHSTKMPFLAANELTTDKNKGFFPVFN